MSRDILLYLVGLYFVHKLSMQRKKGKVSNSSKDKKEQPNICHYCKYTENLSGGHVGNFTTS